MSNVVLETRPVVEIKGNFLVPSYQRGYRWGEDEVTRLLDDVYQTGRGTTVFSLLLFEEKAMNTNS